MLQGFFTPPKRTSYGKNQRKNNGNTQQCKIDIVINIIAIGNVSNCSGYNQGYNCSMIYYGNVASDNGLVKKRYI